MGRKSNAQKQQEEFSRITGVIKHNRNIIEKDLERNMTQLASLLYEYSKLIKKINEKAGLVDLDKRRKKEIETVTPETFENFFDEYFINFKINNTEWSKELLSIEIIEAYLTEYFNDKFGFFNTFEKIKQFKNLIKN